MKINCVWGNDHLVDDIIAKSDLVGIHILISTAYMNSDLLYMGKLHKLQHFESVSDLPIEIKLHWTQLQESALQGSSLGIPNRRNYLHHKLS